MTFSVPHISERLAQVQTRIAELQALQSMAGAVAGADRGFAGALSDAVRDAAAPSVAGGVSDPATAAHAPVEGTSPAGPAATGRRAVAIARQHVGTPYVWGAEHPTDGFDCSGLVQYTFRKLGVDLPRVSRDQARAGRAVASLAAARPGDLVAFGSPVDHIGIYAGNNTMVVAPHRGDVVKVQRITRTPTTIRRVV